MNKLVLILILSVSVFGQTKTFDKFKNQTSIVSETTRIKANDGSRSATSVLQFYVMLLHPGETLAKDIEDFAFIFRASCQRWCFLQSHNLIFLADKTSLDFGKGSHNGNITGSGVSEYMLYMVKRKDVITIADAESSEFQLGSFEGALSETDKAKLKLMVVAGTK